jgi:hypothetical protein
MRSRRCVPSGAPASSLSSGSVASSFSSSSPFSSLYSSQHVSDKAQGNTIRFGLGALRRRLLLSAVFVRLCACQSTTPRGRMYCSHRRHLGPLCRTALPSHVTFPPFLEISPTLDEVCTHVDDLRGCGHGVWPHEISGQDSACASNHSPILLR